MKVYRVMKRIDPRTTRECGFYVSKTRAIHEITKGVIYLNGHYIHKECNKYTKWKEKRTERWFHSEYVSRNEIYNILLHNPTACVVKDYVYYVEEIEVI